MKERAVVFRQSLFDFPCSVELGKSYPTWGIKRWAGCNGLRFVPPYDEGFSLRGNKQQLLYKGRRRSHRFTIHSDTSFEYDCILLREPESNVVTLRMDGAENFDFFKQPDFVPDPFLKGSYAVYKKETLIGQGTGKLCHIHRPLIIDARGRKCWGNLSIVENCLFIIIPEEWLSEAAYPVIVDPTIGTTTIGSQTTGKDPNNKDYDRPWLDGEFTVNKYQVPQNGNGLCTAYLYCSNNNTEGYALPFLYTDVNNKPYKRKSKNENEIYVWFSSPSWKNNTFNLDGNITAGENVWFGIQASWFTTRFDYGGECYKGWFNYNGYEDYEDEPPPYIHLPDPYITSCTIKWSMYFTYTAVTSQNYTRTLTQGVDLSDTGKMKAEYIRSATQSARLTDTRNLEADYKREAMDNVNGITTINILFSFFRQCIEAVGNSTGLARLPVFNRFVSDEIKASDENKNKRDLNIKFEDTEAIADTTSRSQGFLRNIIDGIKIADVFNFQVLFVRTLHETQGIIDTFQQVRNYIRCLYVEAGNIAETVCRGNSSRTINDTVQAEGIALRHLLIFVRILTTSLVRDFIIRRFLIAREELVLKSCVTRELTLDSKIN